MAHHTISHNRRFALSYCLPRPFVSSPTARILSLSDPTASCPTQNSKNVRVAQKFNEFCAPSFQLNRTKGMVCSIQVHPAPAICQNQNPDEALIKRCILSRQPLAQCIRRGMMQRRSALKQEELHQSWEGWPVSVHPAIMSSEPIPAFNFNPSASGGSTCSTRSIDSHQ